MVRRSGTVRRAPSVFMQQVYYYGFLTSLEGDEKGPWLLDFECTDTRWFNDVVENQMPGNYRLARLEQIIGNRDYWTAWENSVAQRVVLRHFYEHYRNIAGSNNNPAPLALYHIQLDSSDVSTRIERPRRASREPSRKATGTGSRSAATGTLSRRPPRQACSPSRIPKPTSWTIPEPTG
ncbi:hypothetical protein A176_003024 [Myxococcus hansupus]|uniref:Uncharacterized protein n=1 Tax=Pseudomyxococcus hansupus TaxID=1297742 RepID=A0A0H4XDJ7_9BACT|nr:hypothetical protein [Myxococcus hansupus]AKQ66112.1 hypothetical protein A176_003024 [Myxococcus hansupus]